ncbi:MAG: response regulator [Moraxella sp.]|nr:response regulator [Moraxella sp.]
MTKRQMGIKSAYGQLILLVFLPIAILASVGAVLVFAETQRAIRSEQDALAEAALIRYEPLVRPLLAKIERVNTAQMDTVQALAIKTREQVQASNSLNELIAGMDSEAMTANILPNQPIKSMATTVQSQQHVQRVAILSKDGEMIASVGQNKDWQPTQDWSVLDNPSSHLWRHSVNAGQGMAYGVRMTVDGEPFWLMVKMDNEPLIIASYRVVLALAITGLVTILLLLLILNIYAKRWIAPIYEMRLYLQSMTVDKLDKASGVRGEGEFKLLQQELVRTMRRLKLSFDELKKHSDETEADLQQAFDEMEMQNISIRKARDLAVSTSRAKSAFLTNISHELRTPLNSIDGFINLLARRGNLDAKQAIYVHTIKKSSAHLLALVNDVLDFSKMEAGKLVLEHHTLNLYDVIYEVADMLSPTTLEKNLRMAVLVYNDVPSSIKGDSLRVKQVLTNLLGNAIKFTDTGGVVISVSLHEQDNEQDTIRVSVTDSGKGVDKDSQSLLFQSFSQGDLSITRRYGGTGLGLVISKELVALMGGRIGFLDNAEHDLAPQGATFWFDIPMVSDEVMMNEPPSLINQQVLVWIAHAASMQVLSASLVDTAVNITHAASFANFLQQLDEKPWDWVIADSFGQDGDITALLRQIRLHYQGRLAIFGYQTSLDTAVLDEYQALALHEPLDRRQVYALLGNQYSSMNAVASRWQGVRVLAVDDHEPNLLVLEALLNEQGIQVVKANSGFEAIEIMTQACMTSTDDERIDLIFMDIQMPRMSGLESSKEIRKLEKSHHHAPIPIIALTAHGMLDNKVQLMAAGIDDYASKPMGQNTLIQLLQKWLGNAAMLGETTEQPQPAPAMMAALHMPTTAAANNDEDGLLLLDWQDAISRSAGKSALAAKLLIMLMNDVETQKQALETAWANRDRVALADVAHRIVGGARYTGVPRLRARAEDFENKCRMDLEAVSASHFIGMRPAYRALIDVLDSLQAVDVAEYLQAQQRGG